MSENSLQQKQILEQLAHRVMIAQGLLPDFSPAVLSELNQLGARTLPLPPNTRDLRALLWCSIDNDDSLDLDQLTVAEALPGGDTRVWVAIADVSALVEPDSAINDHAWHNTTSVYTPAVNFPMLPERLSTDLTSLNPDQNRLAIVVEMSFDGAGILTASNIYPALVRNHAKLAYNAVAAWLEGTGIIPPALAAVPGLDQNLRLQDKIARQMQRYRYQHGALTLQTIESRAIFEGDQISALAPEEKNRAKTIIEDFMIAANGVTARFLSAHGFPSLRRIVREPKRWDRIVEIAANYGTVLPAQPDSKALEDFLIQQQVQDPLRFPDLSLTIIKLLGPGEYVAEVPDGSSPGHFGLAVNEYSHSTAPNRRFPDLITQRLLKAAIYQQKTPYAGAELSSLATHCTEMEDVVKKVERQLNKSAAALLLQSHIGEQFKAITTGAAAKGTWVRLLDFPIEGKLVHGFDGVDVGDRLRVQLISVDVEKGFIDFKRVNSH